MLLTLLPACSAGPRNFENENDRLRRENLELKDKLQEAEKNIDLRLAELQALEMRAAATRPALEGVKGADIPLAVAVRFDRYSGPIDSHGAGADDVIRLYIRTVDQQDRFIPVAGRAVVQAVVISPDRPPTLLAETTLSAPQWDKAYRDGLTGTHYTIEMPLPKPLPQGVHEVTVKLTLTDANTGSVLTCEQGMPLHGK